MISIRDARMPNFIPHQRFWLIILVFMFACSNQSTTMPIQSPTQTVISPTFTLTPTVIPVTTTPSPLPTEPVIPLITPDPIQVERWREYEDALAKAFFKSYLQPEEVVCEWVILGQEDQEVYVWAHCAGIYSAMPSQASIPTVIHIGMDGSVQSAEIPGSGTAYAPSIQRMFPPDVQEIIFSHISFPFSQERADRLRWRRGHPDEPPWIVFSTLTIQPTQSVIPWISPDTYQIKNWKEYQIALAKGFLSYVPAEQVVCEWEFLGQSGDEVYVWATCAEIGNVGYPEGLAVIHIGEDGSALFAEARIDFPTEIRETFPLDVQERYFGGLIHFQELTNRLRWRQLGHSEEPPLIISGIPSTP